MRTHKSLAPILWVIIAAVVLGGGLFAFLLPRILHPVDDDRGQFEFMVAEETKNWNTYRNEKYGFEFKYPLLWILNDEGKTYVQLFSENDKGSAPRKLEIFFHAVSNPEVLRDDSIASEADPTMEYGPRTYKDRISITSGGIDWRIGESVHQRSKDCALVGRGVIAKEYYIGAAGFVFDDKGKGICVTEFSNNVTAVLLSMKPIVSLESVQN